MNKFDKLLSESQKHSEFLNRYSSLIYKIIIEADQSDYLPFDEEIILEGFKNAIIFESEDPTYNVQLSKELETFTKKNLNDYVSKQDLLKVLPEIEQFDIPKVFIGWLDFSNKQDCESFLKSISKINESSLKACKFAIANKEARGMLIDLTVFKIPFVILLFNEQKANSRTIYHEWTHFLQKFISKEKFEVILTNHSKFNIKKNEQLKKFNLDLDFVNNYFFSDKEYITHLDNLLYMIHQTQKLEKYKHLNDNEFANMFIKTFSNSNPKCLETDLAKDILSIDNGFKMNLLFFISMFICQKSEYRKLCLKLPNII